MGRIAVRIGNDITHVVRDNDADKAAQLALDDEAMDDLHRHLFTVVSLNPEWQHGTAAAVDIALSFSRYFERFADHAVDIAGRVVYQSTGAYDDRSDTVSPPRHSTQADAGVPTPYGRFAPVCPTFSADPG